MQSFHDDLSKLKTKTDQDMVSCKQLGVFCTTESMKVTNWGQSRDHLGTAEKHASQEKKPSYFPQYWFFNKDPYNGLL